MKKRGRTGVGRRSGKRTTVRKRRTARQNATLSCPMCARAFLIGPEFVTNIVATGRIWPSGRAEIRCGICGHTWWSRHPEALRKARVVTKPQPLR
jgi:transcription elongation factor Elf1